MTTRVSILSFLWLLAGCTLLIEPSPKRCGNGLLDPEEQCDGTNLNGNTCMELDPERPFGTLRCEADCTYDSSGCSGSCGNGQIDGEEQCDGTDFGGMTCSDFGHPFGNLRCVNCAIDSSACSAESLCGNGQLDGGEECDGDDLGGMTCAEYDPTNPLGTIRCKDECTFDTSLCVSVNCGNGQIDGTEECDGDDFGSASCPIGYTGSLECLSNCMIDYQFCIRCGNGTIDSEENCEGAELNGATCETLGYSGGTLGCHAHCVFDTTMCQSSAPLQMVYVPAGQFQRDEIAQNLSNVSAFLISSHEITRALFLDVMGVDPSDPQYSLNNQHPVQMVNWFHAIAFCNKLSLREGLTPVYHVDGVDFAALIFDEIPLDIEPGVCEWCMATANWAANGYRLPTEMEYMWAAMGAMHGYFKPFAGSDGQNQIGDYAVFGFHSTEAGRTTTERSEIVGSKSPNELGLYDLSGNIFEWVWDQYEAYPDGVLSDYTGATAVLPDIPDDDRHILRGGSWANPSSFLTIAHREIWYSTFRNVDIGFRVVRHHD